MCAFADYIPSPPRSIKKSIRDVGLPVPVPGPAGWRKSGAGRRRVQALALARKHRYNERPSRTGSKGPQVPSGFFRGVHAGV
tara:strand:- start:638 stop:883 length:246 start_codon:yes stop_codon:yes gene_type:complete